MKIIPLASESLGVRSLACFVETKELNILIDAGVSLGPRFYLLPHPKEYKALKRAKSKIREYAKKAHIISLSHYHLDHYTPTWDFIDTTWTWGSFEEAKKIYGGKKIFIKDFKRNINPNQRKRGYIFNKMIKDFSYITYCDEKKFEFEDLTLKFSRALPHGEEGTQLGYVLALFIKEKDDSMLFCSDTEGPMSDKTLRYFLRLKPKTLIISGPPLYLQDFKVRKELIDKGIENLGKLARKIPTLIVDHHLLRDERGLEVINRIKDIGKEHGNRVYTYAEYMGKKNELLECYRAKLYREEPPLKEFQEWAKSKERLKQLPPL
ncbi:MAG: hypothetical protein QXX95_03740 [Nitrososphaerales archaeon]